MPIHRLAGATGTCAARAEGTVPVSQPDAPRCLFCGQPERAAIFEIWDGHEFMLETRCEGLHETLVNELDHDPGWARVFLKTLGIERMTGYRIRRLADDGACGLLLDWQLELAPITLRDAKAFITRHHAHCGAPVGWRFGVSVRNGPTTLGVVTVGNPVAAALCNKGIIEVNRLCIRRDVPHPLRWNAASMLYGWSAREAARRGWQKIITYTRADEDGTSLRAAGWTPEARVRGRGWHSSRRSRSNRNGWVDKVRWSREFANRTGDCDHVAMPDGRVRRIA